MEVIKLDNRVIYRADKGKKVKFVNDPKNTLYSEIEVLEETDRIVEVE